MVGTKARETQHSTSASIDATTKAFKSWIKSMQANKTIPKKQKKGLKIETHPISENSR
jgi:hypothetical protein